MHDGAPCHCSKAVKQFAAENSLATLDCPGNSSDLNPVENLWAIVKIKVADKQPSSAGTLNQAIKEVWVKEIRKDYYEKLISSMLQRIQAVITEKEDTKY